MAARPSMLDSPTAAAHVSLAKVSRRTLVRDCMAASVSSLDGRRGASCSDSTAIASVPGTAAIEKAPAFMTGAPNETSDE